MEIVVGIVALVAGAAIAWIVAGQRGKLAVQRERGELERRLAVLESEAAALRLRLAEGDSTLTSLRQQLDVERQERARAETRMEEGARRIAEQQRLLDEAEKKLKDAFASLSADALKSNAEQFLATARKTLEVMLSDARGDLGKRQEAIQALVQPIADSLKRYESQIQGIEQARQKAYGSLEEQLKSLGTTSQLLQQETGRLTTALRNPRVRGRWGELALRRAAEIAGMTEHCDFVQQLSVESEDARFRPDLVVNLPNGRTVVVDAKAVVEAYLDAVTATDETARSEHLARHAQNVRSRVRELSGKGYWERFEQSPEVVVLFLPGESFFSAALEADPRLLDEAGERRVILASPTTLIALLRAVAFGWRQERLARNAEQISRMGRELYERMRTLVERLDKVGVQLGRTVSAYNDTVGTLESRVLPSARRFRELGAGAGDELSDVARISETPRQSSATLADKVPDRADEASGG